MVLPGPSFPIFLIFHLAHAFSLSGLTSPTFFLSEMASMQFKTVTFLFDLLPQNKKKQKKTSSILVYTSFSMVNVKFRTQVVCQIGLDKQCRPRSDSF